MYEENFWNDRYRNAGEQYLFGIESNLFLARHAALFQKGSTGLLVADGEGRNSVWLARQGLQVAALDISAIAVEKARRLAQQHGVDVDLIVGDMSAVD
jgi:2-polyprenyl-3-methyl-5-hydroxy-6-metoxy-1,4-benzoquinol methylase